jgi:hypothetical protein
MAGMRRFFFGSESEIIAAMEVCFYDDFVAWLCSLVALTMALDSWQMWFLALGRNTTSVCVFTEVVGPAMLIGLAWSVIVTWRRLRLALQP